MCDGNKNKCAIKYYDLKDPEFNPAELKNGIEVSLEIDII